MTEGGTRLRTTRRAALAGAAGLMVVDARVGPARAQAGAATMPAGAMELVVAANAPSTPTGMTVSAEGRIFIFMPRIDAKIAYSVGEVARDGSVTPYPDAGINRPDPQRPRDTLFFVPNGVMDGRNRLWMLDGGLMDPSGAPVPGAAKLMCIDISNGAIVANVPLGSAVEATSSLNDLRIDAGNGRRETAYVTDQGQGGQGAIIAVDLATGRAVRRLARHPSTASTAGLVKMVEGRQMLLRSADGATKEIQGGANGIALSPDASRLYYAPLMGRHLYSANTAALLDPQASDDVVAATVQDLGEKGFTGGLQTDDRDRVYLALQEHNAVGRRTGQGTIEIVASDPRLIWADTMWIHDGWLYINSAQVNRLPGFNGGRDMQRPPYAILRTRIDAGRA
ncbi:MAG: hypothetical protein H7Z10_06660 [Gemmatimonadaceae bacterium]|nr:hypothetical protein [Acetobacteraceae bacterium]